MGSNIEIYSKGGYSTWCYHLPTRTLFDCGEGFATYQGNYCFGVERVFISHSHTDHVSGLFSFLYARNCSRGDKEKPLDIYYPDGDQNMEKMIDYIKSVTGFFKYKLTFIPLKITNSIAIDNRGDRYVECFPMEHQKRGPTYGYRIMEVRKRLKFEYVGKDIRALKNAGITDLNETYVHPIFAYCCDAYNFNYTKIHKCDMVVIDCTFLNATDRERDTHFDIEDMKRIYTLSGCKKMVAAHISSRYNNKDIETAFKDLPMLPILHGKVTKI